jgi:hypothetical protein
MSASVGWRGRAGLARQRIVVDRERDGLQALDLVARARRLLGSRLPAPSPFAKPEIHFGAKPEPWR